MSLPYINTKVTKSQVCLKEKCFQAFKKADLCEKSQEVLVGAWPMFFGVRLLISNPEYERQLVLVEDLD